MYINQLADQQSLYQSILKIMGARLFIQNLNNWYFGLKIANK